MPELIQLKYEKLFHVWNMYKNTLEDAEIMLKRKQNEFLKLLKETQTNLKLKAKDLLQTFLETAPISTKWKSNGKQKKNINLKINRNQYYMILNIHIDLF